MTHPTPWKAESFDKTDGIAAIYDANGVMVESVYGNGGDGEKRSAIELAQRIVTAVNYYESMCRVRVETAEVSYTCFRPMPCDVPGHLDFQPYGLGNERTHDMGGNAHSTEVKVETEDATTTVSTPDEASTDSTSEESTDSSSDTSTEDSSSDDDSKE